MMTYADTGEKEAHPMLSLYHAIAEYLGWKDAGTVVAPGVWTSGSVRNTKYGEKAYLLGKGL
ncbi:MAG: hypothetical protein PUB21_11965 [Bacteroidales bacterium]|nr:hypothetical protein [Bacteroidales bacterium]